MTLDEYQDAAGRTQAPQHVTRDNALSVLGLGLTGEAGEVADLIKKYVGHGHPLDEFRMAKELGDVLWYVAMAARAIGYPLDEIAEINIDKLQSRYPDGFSTAASLNRPVGHE